MIALENDEHEDSVIVQFADFKHSRAHSLAHNDQWRVSPVR